MLSDVVLPNAPGDMVATIDLVCAAGRIRHIPVSRSLGHQQQHERDYRYQ